MAIEKYIIDKSDLTELLRGEVLAIQPKGNIKGFCVEITGNLTNGDVIKAVFPSVKIEYESSDLTITNLDNITSFRGTWWNAPYREGNVE